MASSSHSANQHAEQQRKRRRFTESSNSDKTPSTAVDDSSSSTQKRVERNSEKRGDRLISGSSLALAGGLGSSRIRVNPAPPVQLPLAAPESIETVSQEVANYIFSIVFFVK